MVKYIFDLDMTLYSTLDTKSIHNLTKMYATFTPKPYLRGLLHTIPYDKYIITNGNKLHADTVIDKLELKGIFKDMVTADMVENLKPHPEPFELAYQRFGIPRNSEEVIFFEDNPDNLQTAKEKYGWTTVFLTNEFNNKTVPVKYQLPYIDFIFRNVEEALLFFMVREHLNKSKKSTNKPKSISESIINAVAKNINKARRLKQSSVPIPTETS